MAPPVFDVSETVKLVLSPGEAVVRVEDPETSKEGESVGNPVTSKEGESVGVAFSVKEVLPIP